MTPQVFFESSLTQTDPMVLDAIKNEYHRQDDQIELRTHKALCVSSEFAVRSTGRDQQHPQQEPESTAPAAASIRFKTSSASPASIESGVRKRTVLSPQGRPKTLWSYSFFSMSPRCSPLAKSNANSVPSPRTLVNLLVSLAIRRRPALICSPRSWAFWQ